MDIDRVPLPAFGLADEMKPGPSPWHSHRPHQLLYAAAGSLRLEVDGGQWILPPQRAAWLPAGHLHRVEVSGPVALRTVYFHLIPEAPTGSRVFAISDLGREMILQAMQWGPEHSPSRLSTAFFVALGGLAAGWAAAASPFRLPAARSPELGRAMRFALDHLGDSPTLGEAARAAGLSTRTLARRFTDEARTSWRAFLHQARMMRALELLGIRGSRVTDVALAVGFESLGAFTTAFTRFAGESPSDYRRRATTGP